MGSKTRPWIQHALRLLRVLEQQKLAKSQSKRWRTFPKQTQLSYHLLEPALTAKAMKQLIFRAATSVSAGSRERISPQKQSPQTVLPARRPSFVSLIAKTFAR